MKFIRFFKDVLRFNQLPASERQICFYCEGPNYWPHLQPIVEALMSQTDKKINYVSSDPTDPGLVITHPNFNGFLIGYGFIRNYFFENLNCQLVIMTMPDLDQYQVKKSNKVGKFIYVHHSLVSHHMVYRPKAFDAFDVIFCSGPHHEVEIKAMINHWQMPDKQLIKHGYGRLDSIIAHTKPREPNHVPVILVAPTWGENGTLEQMGEQLIDVLMTLPYHVILRPHPQTVKLARPVIDAILKRYGNDERFTFESGVSSEESLHQSDLMISDWSGAALEYALGLKKPVLFIDVPRKVQNPTYQELGLEPFEVQIRDHIGIVQSIDLRGLAAHIEQLLMPEESQLQHMARLADQHVYNLGGSGHKAAHAILDLL